MKILHTGGPKPFTIRLCCKSNTGHVKPLDFAANLVTPNWCPHPLLCTLNQCNGCLSTRVRGSSWLGCQVLPAYGAVFILELAATSVCSRCLTHSSSSKLFIKKMHSKERTLVGVFSFAAFNYKLGNKMFVHNFKKMTQSLLFGWQPCKERKTNELSSEWVPEVKVCTEGRLLRDVDQSSDLPLQKDDWISSFPR